ncbi:MAG: DUF4268 domain-containing protein [Pseudobacter sp.]|uniref:DUF4268 domain-containing protein n=1 Tax=Pseudobacter sp. TaxID=2045420 RepID=UPI003F7E0DE3
MYTKEEISKLKQAFWTAFGKYMQPISSANGLPVNWMNYKTGINGISFKMNAERDHAVIMIQLNHNNKNIRQVQYQQFLQLKSMLTETLGEDDWIWREEETDWFGKQTSSISKLIEEVNVLDQRSWPEIISFFKPRIMALDEFWNMANHAFE